MKIRPEVAEMFHEDGRMDGRTDRQINRERDRQIDRQTNFKDAVNISFS
jgi:hypothetical protein